jgi:hypothetical protein
VETTKNGEVSIAIVGGSQGGKDASGHRVVLTLAPPEPGTC